MERFMWSFDGRSFNEGLEPIRFERNERVRVNLINNSMMNHPIHIHGHFFELVTGKEHGTPSSIRSTSCRAAGRAST
jgi:FtsP/CotA-like multicopper oxidase with cupredoxin domain